MRASGAATAAATAVLSLMAVRLPKPSVIWLMIIRARSTSVAVSPRAAVAHVLCWPAAAGPEHDSSGYYP